MPADIHNLPFSVEPDRPSSDTALEYPGPRDACGLCPIGTLTLSRNTRQLFWLLAMSSVLAQLGVWFKHLSLPLAASDSDCPKG